MKYTFDIVGVSPVLQFFHQQQQMQKPQAQGVEYLGSHSCTLDAFIKSVETVPPQWNWEADKVVDTVIQFWLNNAESISYWKSRLTNAGKDNLIVARLADITALRTEFELIFGKSW